MTSRMLSWHRVSNEYLAVPPPNVDPIEAVRKQYSAIVGVLRFGALEGHIFTRYETESDTIHLITSFLLKMMAL